MNTDPTTTQTQEAPSQAVRLRNAQAILERLAKGAVIGAHEVNPRTSSPEIVALAAQSRRHSVSEWVIIEAHE